MEWLVVGLGNPGEKYTHTRHNVGFMAAEELAKKLKAKWKESAKFKAAVAEADGYCFCKPMTFMNLSGQAVSKLAQFYKIPPHKIVVIHDDLDLPLGSIKSGFGKGPKQHNGLLSVEQHLGTKDFWRIRIGIENRSIEERATIPGQTYVLTPLNQTETQKLGEGIASAVESFDTIARYE